MKRFYRDVAVEPDGDGWRVTLDGRPVRTAAGNPQSVPTRALAEAMAQEWAGQGEEIDPALFFHRDLADLAIDAVASDPDDTIAALLAYGETDTLCYRADPDEPLFPRQIEIWEPLLKACEARHAIRLARVSGIIHRPQPPETLAILRDLLSEFDPFTLAALRTMVSLSASLTIGLAALEDGADAAALWQAANLEEDWQAEQWGQDWMAAERRAKRLGEFGNALRFAQLARGDSA